MCTEYRIKIKRTGGFMSRCCVICVGRNADKAADRIEAYAQKGRECVYRFSYL